MDKEKEIKNWIQKVEETKKEAVDLSSDEDLSLAIMNLVSIEEHFYFTGAKTGKSEYFKMLDSVREIRKSLLKKLVKNPEGEIWCISKHLLAASMRLIEVGTKLQNKGDDMAARDLFKKAFDLYSLFWGLNLKVINPGEIQKIDDRKLDINDKSEKGIFAKLGELVKKVVDCCKE